ncbi:MAG TPA: VWA domain-containing protein [bacterium]|nr:VWA domain-containing protein [bacterium]HQL63320.1 VWA domain-containing protein [bacterium]
MVFGTEFVLNGLLLLIPLFFFLRWSWLRRRKALEQIGNIDLLERLTVHVSRGKQRAKLAMVFFAVLFLILAMARPQWGMKETTLVSKGRDIIIALDTSASMLAEDITPNRMARAKHELERLIDRLQGDRVGLIVFAGEAFVQCPLTSDYTAAKMFLSEVDVGSVPVPGTSLDRAIDLARNKFVETERQYKVLILLTDGEQTTGDPMAAVEKAAAEGIQIYTIGIGSLSGVPIPIRDEKGQLVEWKKQKNGELVQSRLDEGMLLKIATETGGKYYHASADEFELNKIYEDIEQNRAEKAQRSLLTVQYEDRFQWFLLPAFVLLLLETILSDRKRIIVQEEKAG